MTAAAMRAPDDWPPLMENEGVLIQRSMAYQQRGIEAALCSG